MRRGESRVLGGAFVLLVAMLVITAGNAIFGVGGRAVMTLSRDWLSSAIYILVA